MRKFSIKDLTRIQKRENFCGSPSKFSHVCIFLVVWCANRNKQVLWEAWLSAIYSSSFPVCVFQCSCLYYNKYVFKFYLRENFYQILNIQFEKFPRNSNSAKFLPNAMFYRQNILLKVPVMSWKVDWTNSVLQIILSSFWSYLC